MGLTMSSTQAVLFLIIVTLLEGCCPSDYHQVPMDVPTQALEVAMEEVLSQAIIEPSSVCFSEDWWAIFEDEQLSCFVTTALERNPTLQSAYANILLANASADRLRSTLFPNLLWAADVSRQKLSETALIPFSQSPPPGLSGPSPAQNVATGGAFGIPVYFTQTETEFNLSYDFDIWGKNRNTWAAALSNVQATIADSAFARLQLAIAVAKVYYELQINYKRLANAERLAGLNDRLVVLTRERMDHAINSAIEVQTAKMGLSNSRQYALQIQGAIAVNENKLRAYLAGQFDEVVDQQPILERNLPKVPVPQDLPLRLIAHRPDIVAQLWLIESGGKQIEVARAGFYPDISINALFGFQTLHPRRLFEWPSAFFNVDPAISLPIFDGGLLNANLQGSQINYALAITEYNQMILNAVNEVLDGFAVLQNAKMQLEEYNRKYTDGVHRYRLDVLKAENNLSSDLDVITSEALMLTAYDQELEALGRTYQAILALIKATGGGYDDCEREE